MKAKILTLALLSLWSINSIFAQDRTTVIANSSDISDNLDLRAVASIFGDSENLEDFERRLNDPKKQISNLDLNGDNQVDYLRVIESVEGNSHIIIIQSVLGRDTFQDIATVEVERDQNNRVQVQVVGDVYMYGNDYIYEPVYYSTPVIYDTFWVRNYRPYYSSWYWGYYPGFYVAWAPFPVYTYHNNINIYINHGHHYNYVNYRRCRVAYNNYYVGRRGNAYERQYPNRSFAQRNTGYTNRQELVSNRSNTRNTTANSPTRTNTASTNSRDNSATSAPTRTIRGTANNSDKVIKDSDSRSTVRNNDNPRSVTVQNGSDRVITNPTPRTQRNADASVRTQPAYENNTSRPYGNATAAGPTRTQSTQSPSRSYGNAGASEAQRPVTTQATPRVNEPSRAEAPRNIQRSEPARSSNREFSQQRSSAPRNESGASRGNGNRRG